MIALKPPYPSELHFGPTTEEARTYELTSDQGTVGMLYWSNQWGIRVLAETAEGKWSFKEEGFFQNHTRVINLEGNVDLGLFTWKIPEDCLSTLPDARACLHLMDGRTFFWRTQDRKQLKWSVHNHAGDVLLELAVDPESLKTEMEVTVAPPAAAIPECAVLVLLACHLIARDYRDRTSMSWGWADE